MDVPTRFGGSGFFGDSSDGGHTDVGLFRDGMPGWLCLAADPAARRPLRRHARRARRRRGGAGAAPAGARRRGVFAAGVLLIALYVRIAIEGQGVGFGIAGTFGFAPLGCSSGSSPGARSRSAPSALLQPVFGRRSVPAAQSVAPPAR